MFLINRSMRSRLLVPMYRNTRKSYLILKSLFPKVTPIISPHIPLVRTNHMTTLRCRGNGTLATFPKWQLYTMEGEDAFHGKASQSHHRYRGGLKDTERYRGVERCWAAKRNCQTSITEGHRHQMINKSENYFLVSQIIITKKESTTFVINPSIQQEKTFF